MTTDWSIVGRRIRARREALGLTQEGLGRALGTSANYVAHVERGLAVSEGKLARYAEVLGLSLAFLRYGVALGEDVEAARAEGRTEGRREALAEFAAWLARASSGEQAPGHYRITLRHVGEAELEAAEREVAAAAVPVTPSRRKVAKPRTGRQRAG